MEDDAWGLACRINRGIPAGTLPARLFNHLSPEMNRKALSSADIRKLWKRDNQLAMKLFRNELRDRTELSSKSRRATYPVTGTTPNFGDLWYITDADLEELGPIDLLEGGSPCQAFSAAGKKNGLYDFRSAGLLGFIDLFRE